ncbi:glycosyl hydrolase family 95 catalytic domain-containing protein [Pedobacter steynii]
MEQYKFGSVARADAPPISLQAVWTADNGRIPPWKGDYHHDLNTQLSYWPAYSGNHLTEAMGYINHMEQNKANYKRYTKLYFGAEGIAVPGVTTLDGTEMGGWIQYSLSPTVSSWLAQHYYLQWRYSMDRAFLKNKAYPWIKGTALFLENITVKDANGHRKLKISSSPEINDNDLSAWFLENTNYDLALMKFTFKAAAELATELGLKTEAAKWSKLLNEFDDFSITNNDELKFAPTLDYKESHRHFSHMMAIHPLGLIKWEDGAKAQSIIKNTIQLLDKVGPDYWCGYSYSWLANMKARAKDGEGAAKDLEIFAKAFCSVNSFHLNGDQTKSGLSKFQYRPFTLEGNFAFASGLQEMLLQSYAGFIEIMPAIPAEWKDASFKNLRTEGAFLVSAKKKTDR